MINIIEDVATLTDVKETLLRKFVAVSNICLGHALHEVQCHNENIVEADIGIGKLHIKLDENNILYRFVPSKELEKTLIQTVVTRCSPVAAKLDTSLQEKIDRAYKELL